MDKTDWKNFGLWIDSVRTERGLGVGELANKANVSQQWLQTLRKGGRTTNGQWQLPSPKDDALARLAHALEMSVNETLSRAGRETPEVRPMAEDATERIRSLEEKFATQEEELDRLRRLVEGDDSRFESG